MFVYRGVFSITMLRYTLLCTNELFSRGNGSIADGGALGGVDLPVGGIFARSYALVVWDSRVKTSSIWMCDGEVLRRNLPEDVAS
jgi:hypothetical protein